MYCLFSTQIQCELMKRGKHIWLKFGDILMFEGIFSSQYNTMIINDLLWCNCRLEEAEERYRNRESRTEDLELIHHLQNEIQEKEAFVNRLHVSIDSWHGKWILNALIKLYTCYQFHIIIDRWIHNVIIEREEIFPTRTSQQRN